MRFVTLGVCLGLVLLAGGCDPVAESKLFREGIGTDLSRPDLAAATRAQDNYIGFICQQAGLDVARVGDTVRCMDDAVGSSNWRLIVQAGMNDIDQRCDAYLAWLDDRRRSRAPILSQISAVSTATTSIMRFTGAEANPLSIAAEAFGLATNTFTNANSRLLLEVNHSTVQSVVVNRRNDYRVNIAPVRIDNRPAAIHALRSYLNICMPFTIEMEINTTITAFQFGGAAALEDRALPNSVDTVSAAGIPPRRADKPIVVAPGPDKGVLNPGSESERNMALHRGIALQNALCVAGKRNGDFGTPEMRTAIAQFKRAADLDTSTRSIQPEELADFERAIGFGSCDKSKLLDAYEVGLFVSYEAADINNRILLAIGQANKRTPGTPMSTSLVVPNAAAPGDRIRNAVVELRRHYKRNNLGGIEEGSTIDDKVWKQIERDAAAPQ